MPEDSKGSEYVPSVSASAIHPAKKTTYLHYGKTAADYCPAASAADSTTTTASTAASTPNGTALPPGRTPKVVAGSVRRAAQELYGPVAAGGGRGRACG